MVVTSACTLEVHYIDVVPAYLVVVKDDTLLVEEFEKIGVVEDVGGLAYASGGMRGRHGKERRETEMWSSRRGTVCMYRV
jgi:hypothetical protein